MKYICKICDYTTKRKYDLNRHLKTKKHMNMSKLNCMCGKKYKTKNGLWKHKKNCGYNMQLKIMELEKKNMIMEKKTKVIEETNMLMEKRTNQMMEIMEKTTKIMANSTSGMSTIAKNNKEIINEVRKLKESKNQIVTQNITNNQTNNIQNLSINVFLNEHCQNAMSLTDFIEQLQITFEDLKHTGQTNYVEGISRILIKKLNKMNKLERPIHCSDVKRKVLYIKNEEGWEKDGKHEKITRCIKDVEFKQIQKIPEWTKKENIDIYKDDSNGMKYQKVVLNSMGGMDSSKREKNKSSVIKKLSEITDFKL